MGIISVILLVILGVIVLGLLGWIMKAFGFIFELLLDGVGHGLGCLCWIIAIIILFAVLL